MSGWSVFTATTDQNKYHRPAHMMTVSPLDGLAVFCLFTFIS